MVEISVVRIAGSASFQITFPTGALASIFSPLIMENSSLVLLAHLLIQCYNIAVGITTD